MFLGLLILWVIFNGRITLEILLVGAAVSAALTNMWRKLFSASHHVVIPGIGMLWRYVRYFCALVLEMINSSIRVMYLILHPEEEIKPQLVTFRTKLKKENHKVILANSITLTPGTITVGLKGDKMRVHGLDASLLEGIEDSDMVRRLEKMEGGAIDE